MTSVKLTRGVVQDYFQIGDHVLSTRTADLYNAEDRERRVAVSLWILRHPLGIGSQTIDRFSKRMDQIDQFQPPIAPLIGYGVDAEGVAFSVLNPLDGLPILLHVKDPRELERRFMTIVSLVGRFH